MNFIDDHTREVWAYFMKHKGEVFQHFLNFKAMVEKEKGVNIKCLRFDGGGEYFSNEFSEYLKEHCRNPSLGLATKAKGLQGCEPRRSLGVKAKKS